ncbi:DsbA family protein [Cupriavidus basilensis]
MTDTIDAYYWMQSDWAYFGNPRLKELGRRYGLKVNHKPIDLATVYSRTGGIKLEYRSVERKNYRLLEMKRFREILGMPINLEPKFWPKTGHLPSWFVIAAEALGAETYDISQAIMTALWVDDVNVEDPGELVRIADGLGLQGEKSLPRQTTLAPSLHTSAIQTKRSLEVFSARRSTSSEVRHSGGKTGWTCLTRPSNAHLRSRHASKRNLRTLGQAPFRKGNGGACWDRGILQRRHRAVCPECCGGPIARISQTCKGMG